MWRKSTIVAALLAACALAASCGSDDDQEEAQDATTALTDTAGAADTVESVLDEAEEALEDALTLDLREQNDSGITGTVAFSPTSENTVEVEIELDGSAGGPHPAHIHPGTCANLDPTPKWPLNNVVGGKSKTTVEVQLDELSASEYAVNVHESPENAERYVACADIRNQ
jgi:Cu/Zn superoxide dismutase